MSILNKGRSIFQKGKWILSIHNERKKIDCHKIGTQFGKALVLIPHADDEWIGCSQLIAHSSQEVLLCNMDMSGGDTEELHILRRTELEKLSERFNRKLRTIEKNKDKELYCLIVEYNPALIFLPFFFDWHEEHIKTMSILNKALLRLSSDQLESLNIAMYQISFPIPTKCITHGCAMKKEEQVRKWTIFEEIYQSQNFLPQNRFKANERINGKIIEEYACEVYSVAYASTWMEQLKRYLLNAEEKQQFKNRLSDIGMLRELERKALQERGG